MVRIKRNDAEHEIIREWRALPDNERRTGAHAVRFAMEIKDKYPFRPMASTDIRQSTNSLFGIKFS